MVVAGSASRNLSERVAAELGCELVRPELKRFPDGELYVRVPQELKGEAVAVVQSTCQPQNDNFMELFFLLHVAKDLGAERVSAVVPYLGYARQDKRFEPGEVVSAQTVRVLLEGAGADEFVTVDVHSDKAMESFKIPARNLTAMPLVGKYLRRFELRDPVVLAPDQGALHHAECVAGELQADFDYLVKHRETPTKVKMEPKRLNVRGRDAVLVDDIISTGGTIVEASKILRKQGAGKIYVACTHAVLVGDALEKIRRAGAEEVFATDTIEREISRITVAPLIADALR
ncbi:MAG: ribose-phosphate diphosphokinase [Hadesarchaea archaeon]|nr:ribose-phosphate diphosphokinase [Hadesarchaea archaeon]